MRRRPIVLAVLAIALLAVLALLLGPGGSGPAETAPPPHETLAGDAADLQGGAVADTEDARALPERSAAVDAPAAAAPLRIRGRVRPDPAAGLLGAEVLLLRGQAGGSQWNDMMLQQVSQPGAPPRLTARDRHDPGRALHRAPVAADGTFEFVVPERAAAEAGALVVDLHDRLHVLVRPVAVPGPAEGEDVVDVGTLRPMLGGHVVARVVGLPPGEKATVHLMCEMDPMGPVRNPSSFAALSSGEAHRMAEITGDGRVEFRGVVPSHRVSLLLRGDHHARSQPFPLRAGESREELLRVVPGTSLTVRTVDEAGKPLEGTRVSIRPDDARGTVMMAVVTRQQVSDADGTVRFTGLQPGLGHLVIAEAEDRLSVDKELVVQPDAELTLELGLGHAVTGTVRDDTGAPIAGAHVLARPVMEIPIVGNLTDMAGSDLVARSARRSRIVTDADGTFTITGLEKRQRVQVYAWHEEFVPGTSEPVRAGRRPAEVVLLRGARVHGHVVDATTGEPPARGTVRTMVTMAMVLERPTGRAELAADGSFVLEGLRPGDAMLRIEAPGLAQLERDITLAAGEELDLGELRLEAACTIQGRVVDARGRPVEGAMVRVLQGGLKDNPMMATMFGTSSVRTAVDGSFELADVGPGEQRLLATSDVLAQGTSDPLDLAPGETRRGVVLTLGDGGSIAGRLLLDPGQDLTGWNVVVGQPMGTTTRGATLAPDGSFRVDGLSPGQYQVQAFDARTMARAQEEAQRSMRPGRGFEFGSIMEAMSSGMVQSFTTVRDGEVAEVELDGRALGSTGGTTLAATVRLGDRPLENGWAEVRHAGGSFRMGLVTNGSMEVTGLREGAVTIQVRSGMLMAPVGDPVRLEIPAGATRHAVDIVLPSATIAGRVIDERDGEPLTGAMVRLVRDGGDESSSDLRFGFALADAKGHFEFTGLAEGSYTIIADQRLGVTDANRAGGRIRGIAVTAGEERTDLVLRARAGAGLEVTVEGPDGSPVPHAMLLFTDRDGQPAGSLPLTAADGEGRAFVRGLPPGELRVVARGGAFAPAASDVVEVEPGQRREVRVRLSRGPQVVVEVVDESSGRPLADAALAVRIGDGPWIPGSLLLKGLPTAGVHDLGALPSGAVRFRVLRPGAAPFEVEHVVPAGRRARVVLALP